MRQLPNIITAARMIAVGPLIWLLATERYEAALWLTFIAGASDAIDGLLAKQFGWITRLGGILDPLADKMMLIACYVVLGLQGVIPLWLVWLVVARDLVIISGGMAYHWLVERVTGEPSVLSKLNTAIQILLVLWLLVDLGLTPLPAVGVAWLIVLTASTTAASGLDYVVRWGYRTWLMKRKRR